jgi:ribosomal-protein-alanine N-acetyltransferase
VRIPISETLFLTEIGAGDKAAFVEHLNDPEIYERTLRIPFPYTETDADKFLEVARAAAEQYGQPVHFAVRQSEGAVIGACGFDGLVPGHRAELGYWLARPFRGQGIMTATVAAARDYALDRWKLARITAHVFSFNAPSARVLEKNGFVFEGVQRKAFLKDGRFLDARAYAYVQ